LWNLPRGVLKFALNASIDTLPTFTNLIKWGKRASVNCQLCGNTVKQTLFHVLFHCNHTTDQGSPETHCGLPKVRPRESEYSGSGLQTPGGGSIPAEIMAQAQRPDLVILDRSDHGRHRISLVEFTCPWDTDADKARDRKISKYAGLKVALSNEGLDCGLYTIEVGAGFIFDTLSITLVVSGWCGLPMPIALWLIFPF
jgi:hypothetical protein